MTKEQVLSILYSERSRLQEKYNTPGWTISVIVATMATIFYQGVNLALKEPIDWDISFVICFFLFDFIFVLGFLNEICKKRRLPVFVKNTHTEKNSTIFIIIYLTIHFLWMCSFCDCIYTKFVCLPILGYFVVLYIFGLKELSNENGFKNIKPDKVLYLYPILFLIVCVSLFIYFHKYYTANISINSVNIGMLLFAFLFLINHLYKYEFEMLKKIDRLIDRTLYDNIENYDVILEELEQMTVGVDIERYLLKQHYEVVESTKFIIKKEYEKINDILLLQSCLNDSVLDIEQSFKEIDERVEFFKNSKKYINDMLIRCYGRDNQIQNNKLSKMIKDIEQYIYIHTTMYSKYKAIADIELYRRFFIEEYHKCHFV